MTKPLLQIALDATDMKTALASVANIAEFVDVIEVGTILAFGEGVKSVTLLRERYPNHIIVCDMKITDASAILTKMALEAGANWVTVSAAAHIETIRSAQNVAQSYKGEVQIELYGHWTLEDAKAWVNMGITQAIYHRSRDAELADVTWTDSDLIKMKALSDLGIELSITGGVCQKICIYLKTLKLNLLLLGGHWRVNKG